MRLLILLFAVSPAMHVAADRGETDPEITSLIISDAADKLSSANLDYETGAYDRCRKAGFSDAEIRGYMRPPLEQHGFSKRDIVRYFTLFDVNYRGGEGPRPENQKKFVEIC